MTITKDAPRKKESNVVDRFKRRLKKYLPDDLYSWDKPPANQFGGGGRADVRLKIGWFFNVDVEMKTKGGTLSKLQLSAMERNNKKHPLSPYIVCYGDDGVDELIDALRKLNSAVRMWDIFMFAERAVYPAVKRTKQNKPQNLLVGDMPFTHSMLNEFATCAKKYHGNYHTKNHRNVWTSTPKKEKGKQVHEGFEMALTHGMALPPEHNHGKNKTVYNRIRAIQAKMKGELVMEMGLAVDKNGVATPYNNKAALFRGKLDITIISHDQRHIYLGDLKNGKSSYSTPKQLERSAVLLFAQYPRCEFVIAEYHWLREPKEPEVLTFERTPSQIGNQKEWKSEQLLRDTLAWDIAIVKQSEANNNWPENPGGLCNGYCANRSCSSHPEHDATLVP